MSGTVRVYCPNHGLIETIETDVFYKGRPPMPEFDNAYCPKCGSPTKIVRSKSHHGGYSWTLEDEKKFNRKGSIDINKIIMRMDNE